MKIIDYKLKNEKATLRGYVHEKSREMPNVDTRPAVLVFPGGGYMMCSDREADPIALAYLAEGYNTFILRYSVGVNEPVYKAFEDADEAMGYLHSNADALNIDSSKIAVVGFSAGGHLTAWLSVFGKIKPNAAILGYPAIIAASGRNIGKELPELCAHVDNTTPSSFIFTTREDMLVPVEHSLQYAAALDKANVDFEMHVFSKGSHGLSLARTFTSSGKAHMVNDEVAQWFDLSIRWLKGVIGDFTTSDQPIGSGKIDSHSPIAVLMSNEKAWEMVIECFPFLPENLRLAEESGRGAMMKGASIRQISSFSPDSYPEEQVDILDSKLAQL